jgi:hypothetical protein
MNDSSRKPSNDASSIPPVSPEEPVRAAMRYWEPRRLIYNLALTAVVVVWITATWPHFEPAMSWFSLLRLCILALIANALYSAVYVVEFAMLGSSAAPWWSRGRFILWFAGTLLALLLENYWIADEIYPFVR